jgi:hypothetical protein
VRVLGHSSKEWHVNKCCVKSHEDVESATRIRFYILANLGFVPHGDKLVKIDDNSNQQVVGAKEQID